jgi:hypothetical protein
MAKKFYDFSKVLDAARNGDDEPMERLIDQVVEGSRDEDSVQGLDPAGREPQSIEARLPSKKGNDAVGSMSSSVTPFRRIGEQISILWSEHPFGGVVFAFEAEARRLDRIYWALEHAKTWGEFRRLLPEGEWDDVVEALDLTDQDNLQFEDDQSPWIAFLGQPFDACELTGDGDYPKWLQQHMDKVLPPDLVEKYGEWQRSSFNGEFLHIDPDHIDEIVTALRNRGYQVDEGRGLTFY